MALTSAELTETSFAKLKNIYAKHIGKSESSIRFKFQGRLINDNDTPKSFLLRQHSEGKMEEIQLEELEEVSCLQSLWLI